jgi:hypothetical protein
MFEAQWGRATTLVVALFVPASGCSVLIQTNDLNAFGDPGADASQEGVPGMDDDAGSGATPDAGSDSTIDAGAPDQGAAPDARPPSDSAAESNGETGVNPPAEAGAGDGSASDAPTGATDGPAQDSGARPDAMTTFCASLSPQPTLCVDFDEGAPYNALFAQTTGTVGADGTSYSSPPDSFFATISAGASLPASFMSHRFASMGMFGMGSNIEYAFDLFLEQYVHGQSAVVGRILINAGTQWEHDLGLVVSDTSATVEESFAGADGGIVYIDTPLQVAPQPNKWTRVVVTLSPRQQTVTVTVGGAGALTNAPLDPSWSYGGGSGSGGGFGGFGNGTSIYLGMDFVTSTSGPWAVRYDNVVANLY